jgi:hypothetical protein
MDEFKNDLEKILNRNAELRMIFENYEVAHSGLKWLADHRLGPRPCISDLAERVFETESALHGVVATPSRRKRAQKLRPSHLVNLMLAMDRSRNGNPYENERDVLFVAKDIELRVLQINCLKSAMREIRRSDVPGTIWKKLMLDAEHGYESAIRFHVFDPGTPDHRYWNYDRVIQWLNSHRLSTRLPTKIATNLRHEVDQPERESRVIMFRE